MTEISIPVTGYGFGSREYGEGLQQAYEEAQNGVEYIATFEEVSAPDDWSDEEKEDFPIGAINLILRPKP